MQVLILAFLLFSFSAHAATKPCRVDGFATEVQCGQIERPLNPADPSGKKIQIHYMVLQAQDRNKLADPVFMLAGGPGQSAINVASWAEGPLNKLQRRRDLVFVDQRGTGRSAPLECPETQDLSKIADAEWGIAALKSCKAQLQKLPYGDLRFFTTAIAVQDLEAVRKSEGYPAINLLGVSYGTRVGLEYLRQYPQTARRVVLDGVVPPDYALSGSDLQKALDSLFGDCSHDTACQKAYPLLAQSWRELLASLPKATVLKHPRLNTEASVSMSRDTVLGMVSAVLYSPLNSSGLPFAITEAKAGRFNPLLALSGMTALPNPGNIAVGMHYSVWCAEEAARLPLIIEKDDFGRFRTEAYRKICADWPRGEVPAVFYTLPKSPQPVLLLSGGLDPVTPPAHAAHVAQALGAKARQVVLGKSGHGMLMQSCVDDLVYRFINSEDPQKVELSCVKPIPRPVVWVLPKS
ncbi:alpha/beta hydrolase [Iodobacter sp. CM08]|uniref:alpha/beta hydrolase n=1 Tax=Iodobacter sp. CM08 TaxID=3085902 RepID=UPI00298139C7|nr:alpha/beta hydrolase [Iodobacter sp. CM08]MDW5417419.1 alpha/beta hydrolase [Iodobacter sp. CM08]